MFLTIRVRCASGQRVSGHNISGQNELIVVDLVRVVVLKFLDRQSVYNCRLHGGVRRLRNCTHGFDSNAMCPTAGQLIRTILVSRRSRVHSNHRHHMFALLRTNHGGLVRRLHGANKFGLASVAH